MSPPPETPLRVAVIGAGMGGLVLAVSLQKYSPSTQVDIYESTNELAEVGVGISMFPRVWEIFRDLELEDSLLEVTGTTREAPLHSLRHMKADEPKAIEFYNLPSTLRLFHRSQLQQVLINHLRNRSSILHFSKRLVSYTDPTVSSSPSSTEPITLNFKDGTSATCDVLVGSDGIRSAVRRGMFTDLADAAELDSHLERAAELRQMVDPVWSGIVAHRGLAPTSAFAEKDLEDALKPTMRIGKNKNIISYPILQGKMINVAALVSTPGREGTIYDGPWATSVTTEEVMQHYATWDSSTARLIEHMENPSRWAIHKVRQLPTFVHGRVALIGDAAHAMTPFQGAGAAQAIEDGFLLACTLAHPSLPTSRPHLPGALAAYDALCRPPAQALQRASDENGHLYHLHRLGWEAVSPAESAAGGGDSEGSRARLAELAARIDASFARSYKSSLADDRARVMEEVGRLCV